MGKIDAVHSITVQTLDNDGKSTYPLMNLVTAQRQYSAYR